MNDLDEARRMLAVAARDLRAVELVKDIAELDDAIVGFHVQQAIEKSLKAWITAVGAEYPFIHDLSLLLETLTENGQAVERFRRLAAYSVFAVRTRYETTASTRRERAPLDRVQALADARGVHEHVRDLITQMSGET
jgi:HEPN domain-containing protein